MAIVERKLPGNKWERTYTGKDIAASKGELASWGRESYQRKFESNKKIGFEKMSDLNGNEAWFRGDQVDQALKDGYGKVALAPRTTVPELPWPKQHVEPGRHRYRYDKESGTMVEV